MSEARTAGQVWIEEAKIVRVDETVPSGESSTPEPKQVKEHHTSTMPVKP
jgi:hypothetical protein